MGNVTRIIGLVLWSILKAYILIGLLTVTMYALVIGPLDWQLALALFFAWPAYWLMVLVFVALALASRG